MKNAWFERDEDPLLRMPSDEVLPAPSEQEITAVKNAIKLLEEDIVLYREMGLSDDVQKMEKELSGQKEILARMLSGEETVIKAECSVYEVAYVYLKRCFARDESMVAVARGDLDIEEDLLNDVLGIRRQAD